MPETQEKGQFTQEEVERYLAITTNAITHAVDNTLSNFDFEKAERALVGCDWRFVGANRSPNQDDLRQIARKILTEAAAYGSGVSIHSGPLRATTKHYDSPSVVSMSLELIPAWWSSVFVDGRAMLAENIKKQRRKKKRSEKVIATAEGRNA